MNLAELVSAGLPDLMQQHGHQMTANQRQALRAIAPCRTGALGTALFTGTANQDSGISVRYRSPTSCGAS